MRQDARQTVDRSVSLSLQLLLKSLAPTTALYYLMLFGSFVPGAFGPWRRVTSVSISGRRMLALTCAEA